MWIQNRVKNRKGLRCGRAFVKCDAPKTTFLLDEVVEFRRETVLFSLNRSTDPRLISKTVAWDMKEICHTGGDAALGFL